MEDTPIPLPPWGHKNSFIVIPGSEGLCTLTSNGVNPYYLIIQTRETLVKRLCLHYLQVAALHGACNLDISFIYMPRFREPCASYRTAGLNPSFPLYPENSHAC